MEGLLKWVCERDSRESNLTIDNEIHHRWALREPRDSERFHEMGGKECGPSQCSGGGGLPYKRSKVLNPISLCILFSSSSSPPSFLHLHCFYL